MLSDRARATLLIAALTGAPLLAQSGGTSVRILLPERTRLLQGQLVDLVLEVRNAASVSGLKVTAAGADLTSKFAAPKTIDLDCDGSSDLVLRADLQSFDTPGDVKLEVSLTAGGTTVSDSRTIQVREFSLGTGPRRSIILFIGDAMGTTYRDAARLVAKSIVDANGKSSFREGFFDDLLEMDKMRSGTWRGRAAVVLAWRNPGSGSAVFGPPKMAADFGPGLQSWQYRMGHVEDHDEFTHVLVFRKSDGALISVARNYAPERNVDAFFPVAATKVYWYQETGQPEYSVRLRLLPGGRVLMAMGTSKPRQTTGQIVLTRESELGRLYPWLGRTVSAAK